MRRQHERVQLFVNPRLRRRDRAGAVQEEQTVTENLGRGGARVPTTLPVSKGETLTISSLTGTASTQAVIRNVRLLAAAGAPPLPTTPRS